jgi:hypothetical protein
MYGGRFVAPVTAAKYFLTLAERVPGPQPAERKREPRSRDFPSRKGVRRRLGSVKR